MNKLKRDRLIKIKKLVKKSIPYRDIAKKIGCSIERLRSICSDNGIKKPPHWSVSDIRTLKRLLNKKVPTVEIARILNRPLPTVYTYCCNHNLKSKATNPIDPKLIPIITEMSKQKMHTGQIRKIYPQVSQRQILYYKDKFNIDGIQRGGFTSIPAEELIYMRKLGDLHYTINEILKKMREKFNRSFTYEQMRGRCRHYNIRPPQMRDVWVWQQKDLDLLRELTLLKVKFSVISKRFPDKSPRGIRDKMKAFRCGY